VDCRADGGFIDQQQLTVAEDHPASDHDRLNMLRPGVVDDVGEDALCGQTERMRKVQDDEVCFLSGFEAADLAVPVENARRRDRR